MNTEPWKCMECDDTYPIAILSANKRHTCHICGTTLTKVTAATPQIVSSPSPVADFNLNGSWEGLYDILGDEFRDAVQQSMALSAPNRQINSKYLSTLGKIAVDSRFSILYDISIVVGPLTILGVSAIFGYLPDTGEVYENSMNFVIGSNTDSSTNVRGSALCLNRGVTSFESKAQQATDMGAAALVVFQTYDIWPFMMTTDSAQSPTSSIPVVMVSKLHSELIQKIATNTAKARTSPVMRIKIGERVTECSVCQDNFNVGDEVLKLPCRHVYHCHCVTAWLQNNHTCPLCRLQLPRELPANPGTTPAASNLHDVFY